MKTGMERTSNRFWHCIAAGALVGAGVGLWYARWKQMQRTIEQPAQVPADRARQ